jgi:hypothetical protein
MKFNIYLEDLNDEAMARIKAVLRYDLDGEIEEAVQSGISRDTAEMETVNNYLNCHNFGIPAEL